MNRAVWHRRHRRRTVIHLIPPPPRRGSVIVDLEEVATGAHSTHVVTPGDTLQVVVTGYITMESGPPARIDFPVRIRAYSS